MSELKPVQAPDTTIEQTAPPLDEPTIGQDGGLPAPNPIIRATPQAEPGGIGGAPGAEADKPAGDVTVEILTDPAMLPESAQRMRQLILEAAATGDPEKLRPLLGTGPTATQLAFSQIDADPVDYLRSISGDAEGQEILAILIDLLNTGFVRIDAGKVEETYIWPYFAALPLESLSPPQRVELLRLVTAGDVEDMRAYGGYNFYRIGISAEGEWRFFMAGD
ncbi:hypothetical protein [Hoeflea halophila]|uniref:hypothetical protein n=1 Tax=Hoeflea halophila TaxID=714899 RepID=UPI00117B6D86|nr:hypothetical protein [Hoeflea halophila]